MLSSRHYQDQVTRAVQQVPQTTVGAGKPAARTGGKSNQRGAHPRVPATMVEETMFTINTGGPALDTTVAGETDKKAGKSGWGLTWGRKAKTNAKPKTEKKSKGKKGMKQQTALEGERRDTGGMYMNPMNAKSTSASPDSSRVGTYRQTGQAHTGASEQGKAAPRSTSHATGDSYVAGAARQHVSTGLQEQPPSRSTTSVTDWAAATSYLAGTVADFEDVEQPMAQKSITRLNPAFQDDDTNQHGSSVSTRSMYA